MLPHISAPSTSLIDYLRKTEFPSFPRSPFCWRNASCLIDLNSGHPSYRFILVSVIRTVRFRAGFSCTVPNRGQVTNVYNSLPSRIYTEQILARTQFGRSPGFVCFQTTLLSTSISAARSDTDARGTHSQRLTREHQAKFRHRRRPRRASAVHPRAQKPYPFPNFQSICGAIRPFFAILRSPYSLP